MCRVCCAVAVTTIRRSTAVRPTVTTHRATGTTTGFVCLAATLSIRPESAGVGPGCCGNVSTLRSAMLPDEGDTISELQSTFPWKIRGIKWLRPLNYMAGFASYLEGLRSKGIPPFFSEPTIPTETPFPGGSAFDAIPKAYFFRRDDPVIPYRAQKDLSLIHI